MVDFQGDGFAYRGAISWFSRTENCVSLSTSESEHIALSGVAREVIFFRGLQEIILSCQQQGLVPAFEDSDGAAKTG